MIDADEIHPINKELSPGEILQQARLQAGLTQEQVAKELYMTVSKVKSLEGDDYSRLKSDTFARGYIRAYASLVKVDVVIVLAAYDFLMDKLKPQEIIQKHVQAAAENNHRGAWQFLAVIGVFLVGLWLISVWFFDNHSDEKYVTTASGISVASSAKSVLDGFGKSDDAALASTIGVGGSGSVSSIAVLNTRAVVSASVAEVTAIEPRKLSDQASSTVKKHVLDELSFTFHGESWLEVSDSRGDVLATELEPSGSNLKLVGLAPFDVKLGNAPVVDVYLNGKKIDVIPVRGSNVLTLKVDN